MVQQGAEDGLLAELPARVVFGLLLLFYLFGPARAPEDPQRMPSLTSAIAAPVEGALRFIYEDRYPAVDQARWAERLIGATLTTGALALTFLALRRVTTLESAWLLTAAAAFASPLWSWTSRANVPEAAAAVAIAALLWLTIRSRGRLLLVIAAAGSCLAFELWRRNAPLDVGVPVAYLLSPGRGLVFFAPLFILAIAALLRPDRPRHLAVGAGALLALAIVEIATRPEPWGPPGFGPTQLAPFVPLIAAMVAGLPRVWIRTGALLCVPATIAHGAAVFMGGHTWDERRAVPSNPGALWDFADSPFTDLLQGPPKPDPASFGAAAHFMKLGDHITRQGHQTSWLAYGWELPEPKGVWATGRESWLAIGAPPGDYVLTLIVSAPRRRGRHQRLRVERPSGPPLELEFSKQLWEFEPLKIPFTATRNVSVLKLQPAHTRMPGHGDVRRCAFFVAALQLADAVQRGHARAPFSPTTSR